MAKEVKRALEEKREAKGSVYNGATVKSALPKPSYDMPKTNGKRTVKRAMGK